MRILVATDGSRGSAAALTFAARLASRDPESELIVLTVDSEKRDAISRLTGQTAGGRAATRHGAAQRILDNAAREVANHGAAARFQRVSSPRVEEVPEAISREADRQKVDLVVVGSEGRDTLKEWVVGGVALRLIYMARRPVTVVRPSRRKS